MIGEEHGNLVSQEPRENKSFKKVKYLFVSLMPEQQAG